MSEAFKEQLQETNGAAPYPLASFEFEDRGLLDIKGKGAMHTYFLCDPGIEL